ncbi:MAG TPA: hypothetical protein VJ739_11385 [Gemmataceae bacterium]|nr:hypothetical protein [Gemmataceae bacterium]
MEIQALRLLLTEHDLHHLAVRGAGPELAVRDLRVGIAAEGVSVSGTYPTSFLDVPFVTLWHLSVRGGRLAARLASVQTGNGAGDLALDVFGLISPGAVRGTLMNAVARAVQGEDGLCVEGEAILVDFDRLAARSGLPVRTNLTGVRCGPGCLVLESSPNGTAH